MDKYCDDITNNAIITIYGGRIMGFTIEDMLIIAKEKYDMELIAGQNGWANSISWLLMVEDTTITTNFKGKELVVTTGLGFDTEEKLLSLVKTLDDHHGAGLIINTGFYITEVPETVIGYCNQNDLPLMTVPWDVVMSEMIKDLTVRIFLQTQTDEQTSKAFIASIERPGDEADYRDSLSAVFDVDGKFQVVLFTTDDLDSMDSMDRKRIGYRLAIYLENISHNAHFFYYAGCFILILNAVDEYSSKMIINGFLERTRRRMPEKKIFVGEGSAVMDVSQVHISYERARYAVTEAIRQDKDIIRFDELGLDKILYSIKDSLILNDLIFKYLQPLIDYDNKHEGQLLETLFVYLKCNGSVTKVASQMYIHKNTICYRMGKIKELIEFDIDDGEVRTYLYLACMMALKSK